MKSKHLTLITPEQRVAMREKSRLARIAKAEYAANNLITEYADDAHWLELSRKHNIRLPNKTSPATELKHVKRMLKRFDIDVKEYCDACGVRTLKELVDLSPEWTARAFCGVFLEWLEDGYEEKA